MPTIPSLRKNLSTMKLVLKKWKKSICVNLYNKKEVMFAYVIPTYLFPTLLLHSFPIPTCMDMKRRNKLACMCLFMLMSYTINNLITWCVIYPFFFSVSQQTCHYDNQSILINYNTPWKSPASQITYLILFLVLNLLLTQFSIY